LDFVRLARPHQWAKSVFVLVGPLYGLTDLVEAAGQEGRSIRGEIVGVVVSALLAAGVFALVSSACYVVNDIVDAERDRLHPRKRSRPIASGAIGVGQARAFAGALALGAIVLVLLLPGRRVAVAAWAATYAGNVMLYSFVLKRIVIADVMGLSLGFVIRVIGGCTAVGIGPSGWLLNSTFFIAMFLAFGKRLGERRTMGSAAAGARGVQSAYTDELLRMAVVVTAVAALVTYSAYTQDHAGAYTWGFNLLWLTMLPATYALLRCIVLLERGAYDDPTELAARDVPFQIAMAAFALVTLALLVAFRL